MRQDRVSRPARVAMQPARERQTRGGVATLARSALLQRRRRPALDAAGYARKNKPSAIASRCRLRLALFADLAGIGWASGWFECYWRIRASADGSACGSFFRTDPPSLTLRRTGCSALPASRREPDGTSAARAAEPRQGHGAVRPARERQYETRSVGGAGGGGPVSPRCSHHNGVQPIPARSAEGVCRRRQRQVSAGGSGFRASGRGAEVLMWLRRRQRSAAPAPALLQRCWAGPRCLQRRRRPALDAAGYVRKNKPSARAFELSSLRLHFDRLACRGSDYSGEGEEAPIRAEDLHGRTVRVGLAEYCRRSGASASGHDARRPDARCQRRP
jgi:hypothetical protein